MKRILILLLTTSAIYIVASSNSTGPADSKSHVAQTGCNGPNCHGSSSVPNVATVITFELAVKSTGIIVSDNIYSPNETYTITLTGTNNTAVAFGYALSSLNGFTQVGTYSNVSSGSNITTSLNGEIVVEHDMPILASSNSFTATVDWKAPTKGIGDVGFWLSVNSVDNNGISFGDQWNRESYVYTEGEALSLSNIDNEFDMSLYPNPATNMLNVDIKNSVDDSYQYSVYGTNGAVVAKGQIGDNANSIDVSGLSSGAYFLNLSNGTAQKTINFSKQ